MLSLRAHKGYKKLKEKEEDTTRAALRFLKRSQHKHITWTKQKQVDSSKAEGTPTSWYTDCSNRESSYELLYGRRNAVWEECPLERTGITNMVIMNLALENIVPGWFA